MRILIVLLLQGCLLTPLFAKDRGIFITQNTVENTKRFKQLIQQAKKVGINTFVVDLRRIGKRYDRNIKYMIKQKIKYIVRIVVFPGGGSKQQVDSLAIRKKKLKLIKHAEKLGVKAIQLDYIRYSIKNDSSKQNAQKIKQVIRWFKKRSKAPLQIAVFGETAYTPSSRIGQDLRLFSPLVKTIAPMLYPSHFEPKEIHSYQPYNAIKNALDALVTQFNGQVPNKVITYIETYNYRRKMSNAERYDYIEAQLQAVQDANLDGWYAWSANNYYKHLFTVLKKMRRKQ